MEINQKVPTKEGRLKRYRDEIKQNKQNWTFQNNEKYSTSKSGNNVITRTNNRVARKQNNFGAKYETEEESRMDKCYGDISYHIPKMDSSNLNIFSELNSLRGDNFWFLTRHLTDGLQAEHG